MSGLRGSGVRRVATVHGVVQGVSFRWYTRMEAERLRLVGWVRNEADGTVRVEAQGPDEDVEALMAWLQHGPTHARVTRVDVDEVPTTDVDVDFAITH